MQLPFSVEEFLAVFAAYNRAVWPIQFGLYILSIGVILLVLQKRSYTDRLVSLFLALVWLWTGIVYHLIYFAPINPVAYGFGIIFIIQGLIFLYSGVFKSKLVFRVQNDLYGIVGGTLMLYALVIYPLLGYLLGHVYPAAPIFCAPCPLTIFTFGLLLWTERLFMPKYILIIPFIWSLISISAALTLGIRQDVGLLIASLLGTGLIWLRDREVMVTVRRF